MAAGRCTSVETSSTRLRSRSRSHRAILAAVVVLPAPCRPASSTMAGGWVRRLIGRTPSPMTRTSSSWMTRIRAWPGVRLLWISRPDRSGLDRVDELLDHRQGDVRLEQRHADLPQRVADVLLGEAAAATQAIDDGGKTGGELVEHGVPRQYGQARARALAGSARL